MKLKQHIYFFLFVACFFILISSASAAVQTTTGDTLRYSNDTTKEGDYKVGTTTQTLPALSYNITGNMTFKVDLYDGSYSPQSVWARVKKNGVIITNAPIHNNDAWTTMTFTLLGDVTINTTDVITLMTYDSHTGYNASSKNFRLYYDFVYNPEAVPNNTLSPFTGTVGGTSINYNESYTLPLDFDPAKISSIDITLPGLTISPYEKMDETNLTAWYRFDNSLADSTGNGHNGTGTESYSTVRYNQAINLNNNTIRIPHNSAFNYTTGDTISIIMDVNINTTLASGNRWIITKRDQNVASGWSNWMLGLVAGGAGWDIDFRFLDDPPAAWNTYQTTDADLLTGVNYTIAVTHTFGDNTSTKIWVNETLATGSWTAGNGSDIPYRNRADIGIGAILNITAANQNATGKFDNIMIFRRAITQTDIDTYVYDFPYTKFQTNTDTGNWSSIWNGSATTISIPYLTTSPSRFKTININTTTPETATIGGVTVYGFDEKLNASGTPTFSIGYVGNQLFISSQIMFNHFVNLLNGTGHLAYEYDSKQDYAEGELGYIGSILYSSGWNNTSAQYQNTVKVMNHVGDIIDSCNGSEVVGHMEFFTHFQFNAMKNMQDYANTTTWNAWNNTTDNLDPQSCYAVPEYGNNTLDYYPNTIANKALLQATSMYLSYLFTGDTNDLNWTNNITLKYNRQVQDSGYLGNSESTPTTVYNMFGNTHAQELIGLGYQNDTFNASVDRVLNFTKASLQRDGNIIASGRSAGHVWMDAALVSTAMYQQTPDWYSIADLELIKINQYQYDAYNGTYYVIKNYYHPSQRIGYFTYSYWNSYNLLTGAYLAHSAELFNPYVGLQDPSSLYSNFVDFEPATLDVLKYSALSVLQSGEYTVSTIPRYNPVDTSGNGSAILPFRFMAVLNNSMNYSLIPNPEDRLNDKDYLNDSKDTLYFKKNGVAKYFNTSYVYGQVNLPNLVNNTTISFPDSDTMKVIYEMPHFDTNPNSSIQNITELFEVVDDYVNVTLTINFSTSYYDWYSFPIDMIIDDGQQTADITISGANVTYTKGTETLIITNASATNGNVAAITSNNRFGYGGYGKWNETALQGNMTSSPFELKFTVKISTTNEYESYLSGFLETTVMTAPTNLTNTTGYDWINWTWDDGSNYTYTEVWINGTHITNTTNETYNYTGITPGDYNFSIRGYNSTALSWSAWTNDTTTLPDLQPPRSITNSTNTTGNFWILRNWTNPTNTDFNHTWLRYTNGTTFLNLTNESINLTLSAHASHNISFQTVDNTGNVNSTKVWSNVTIPNNPIIISNVSASYSLNETETLVIHAEYTDADGDTGTFSDDSAKWDVNSSTGVVSWITVNGDNGVYQNHIQVSDGYGSLSTATTNITVSNTIFDILWTAEPPTWFGLTFENTTMNWDDNGNITILGTHSDEFDNGTLDTNEWWWKRENASAWVMGSDYIQLNSTATDMYQSTQTAPLLLHNVSNEDMEIVVKMSGTPDAPFEGGGILFYADDDNFVNVMYYYGSGGTKVLMKKEDNNVQSYTSTLFTADPIYLKLKKVGTNYTSYYSTDRSTWTQYYSYTISDTMTDVGMTAYGSSSSDPEPFRFYYFMTSNITNSGNKGNATLAYNASDNYVVSDYYIEVETPTNTNLTLTYTDTVGLSEYIIGTGLTAINGWINVSVNSTWYQNTSLIITEFGNGTETPSISQIIVGSTQGRPEEPVNLTSTAGYYWLNATWDTALDADLFEVMADEV